jgi:hypothetical protein
MPLSKPQQQFLQNWMRSKAIVQCPACGDARWQFTQASYLRALLEEGESDMAEEKGGSEGHLRQLRVRDALGRRDGRHQEFVGRREGALVFVA